MITVLLLGIIFIIGGILIYYFGEKKGVPNTLLWALFPIIHGFHEFADYVIELGYDALFFEQLEVTFAIGSSIVLLAASIEFLGVVPHPFGKLIAGTSYLASLYFVFGSKHVFETIEYTQLKWNGITTTYFRFYFGFILVFFSIIAILTSYLYLEKNSMTSSDAIRKDLQKITSVSILMLLVFAIFEGFTSTNSIFVLLRGISAIIFLLIPVYVIISSRLQLQTLLITTENGTFLLGYDFLQGELRTDESMVLSGSFIAAINTFARTEARIGELADIKTEKGIFIIVNHKNYLISLLTRSRTKKLDEALTRFTEKIIEEFKDDNGLISFNDEKVNALIDQYFQRF